MNSIYLIILFWLLLLLSCGYALWRGGKYERIAALVFIAATLLSLLGHVLLRIYYTKIQTSDLVVDSAVLLAMVAIAFLSDRFWPLWAAGLQLVDNMSHAMKAIDADLVPQVYGAAERFWSYPMLLILLVGAWRQNRRGVAEQTRPPT